MNQFPVGETPGRKAGRMFALNQSINQLLLEHLAPAAWTAQLSSSVGKSRTIAAIFTHLHNVRCKWIRLTTPQLDVPAQLSRARSKPDQVGAGLEESARQCVAMLEQTLDPTGSSVKQFLRDGWAQPWPAGPEMLFYMLAHEAHHRGQICMLAHQLGFPLTNQATSALWSWEKLVRK